MAFIVFEGLDGSGKSSLMAAFGELLTKKALSFIRTREPGGTSLGEEIRGLILRKEGPTPTPRTELLLYEASRSQHVDQIIEPNLKKGQWVLCDRFSASSIAFQAGGREISEQDVNMLNHFATNGLKPDLTVLLDISVDQARKRQVGRNMKGGEAADRIESEADAFHERVRASFLAQAQADKSTWLVLNAEQSTDSMLKELSQFIEDNWSWQSPRKSISK